MIRVSDHAINQWLKRSDDPSLPPAAAWMAGTTVTCGVLDGDEFRYHPGSETVLVRRDDTLVTVIDPETAIDDRVREAVATVGGDGS